MRTDALAHRKGIKLSDLPEVLGISKAMFFSYRRKEPISAKAWLKLSAAEKAAGIGFQNSETVGSEGKVKESDPDDAEKSDDRMDRIEAALERMAAAMEEMAKAMRRRD